MSVSVVGPSHPRSLKKIAQPRAAAADPLLECVDASVARGVQHLSTLQQADGHWVGANHTGVADTARYLIVERHLGVLTDRDAQDAARFILSQQRSDGTWAAYPTSADADMGTTSLAYGALRVAGYTDASPALQATRQRLDASGALKKGSAFNRFFLQLAGLQGAVHNLPIPLGYTLIPGLDRLLCRHLGAWATLCLHTVPPSTHQPSVEGGATWRHPLRSLENRRTERWLTAHQNQDGDFFGTGMTTLVGAAALHAVGVPVSDPRIAQAISYVDRLKVHSEQGLELQPYSSEVWDTALTLKSLLDSSVPATEPLVANGIRYLLGQQNQRPVPKDWQNPAPHASNRGGWAFEAGNDLGTDDDSTALVLHVLSVAAAQAPTPGLTGALERGWAYEGPMQNPDGGWAAWTHGQKSKKPGVMPAPWITRLVRTPAILRDAATEGLTGRVLSALGARSATVQDPQVQKAIGFLKLQQEPSGAWWERWGINYLQGTSFVLQGLHDVGEDMQQPYIQKAVAWMVARQHEDGGWGETPASFVDPRQAGKGPTSATLTGLVVEALMSAGLKDSEAVKRGIGYLVSHQQPDGGWSDRAPQGVGDPWQKMFYVNTIFPQTVPLQALGQYQGLQRNPGSG